MDRVFRRGGACLAFEFTEDVDLDTSLVLLALLASILTLHSEVQARLWVAERGVEFFLAA